MITLKIGNQKTDCVTDKLEYFIFFFCPFVSMFVSYIHDYAVLLFFGHVILHFRDIMGRRLGLFVSFISMVTSSHV